MQLLVIELYKLRLLSFTQIYALNFNNLLNYVQHKAESRDEMRRSLYIEGQWIATPRLSHHNKVERPRRELRTQVQAVQGEWLTACATRPS